MKKSAIGLVPCCICPFPDAEVKEDKHGLAYIHCPDCTTQVFARDKRRDGMLRARMRPIVAAVKPEPAPEPTAPPGTVTVTVPPVPATPPTAPVPPVPARPAKTAWLTTLLDGAPRK